MPAQATQTMTPSFETVWAGFQEIREIQKETAIQIKELKERQEAVTRQIEETSRQMKERQEETTRHIEETSRQMKERQEETTRHIEETSRQMKERQEETTRHIEETSRQINKSDEKMDKYREKVNELSKSFGRVIEYMVTPNLLDKLKEFNLDFSRANSNSRFNDYVNGIFFEVDVMLENGDKAMLVEVKAALTITDIKEHIKRIEKMRKYADLHFDKRAFLGAVAGVVIRTNVKQYALNQGLYVIEPSGNTFNIIPPNNKPKEW